jgi:hypothetical protein
MNAGAIQRVLSQEIPVAGGTGHARSWGAEILKQSVDQPLHFAMAAGPIWVSRWLTTVPWYGWAIVPALAYREWRQWPSKRWWDPLLDASFMVLGLIATAWPARTRLPMSWSDRRARIVAWSAGAHT